MNPRTNMLDSRDRIQGTGLSGPGTASACVYTLRKHPRNTFGSPARGNARHSGIALVVVLSFIVLISILVVGFFSSVSTELVGAKTYASNVSTQQLSETAVNVVMGQIRTATTLENGAWGSQPGMIRVYRASGNAAGSQADSFFKLYSSDNMVLSGPQLAEFDPTLELPANWHEQPSLFTNLNEPVVTTNTGAAKKHYPIIDPSWASANPYDPDAKIEGFAITPDPNPDVDPGRMPARWIYVLKDGTLTVPQADPNGVAIWEQNVTRDPVPTPGNPIVGRIAFWTDDETSKVNINTAGGFVVPKGMDENSFAGSFWDVPRAYTTFEYGELDNGGAIENTGNLTKPGLSVSQPAAHEYQRYPGHPATTSLGLIFRDLFSGNPEQLYKFMPRLVNGGSIGGTARPTGPLDPEAPYKRRLYASVDELLFAQNDPTSVPSGTGWRRPTTNDTLFPAGGEDARLTPEQVDQLRFFLTAQGRASDLNLFGRPRVSLWPVPPDNNLAIGQHRTAYDRLIAFCASLPGKAYYWRRQDAYSPNTEIAIGRNKELYTYLHKLTSQPVPGVGAAFSAKYGGDRDWILTEMLDYIRTVNLRTSDDDKNYYSPNGLVVPLKITSPDGVETKGFGRMSTITEAALVFYHGGERGEGVNKKKLLRAFLILESYTPSYGYAGLKDPASRSQMLVHEIEGLDQFMVSTESGAPQNLGFPPKGTNVIERRSGATWHGRDAGGPEGFFHTLMPGSKKAPFPNTAVLAAGEYPFQSSKTGVEFPASAQSFKFYGGKITIKLSINADAPKLLQTFDITFPNSEIPGDEGSSGTWPFPRHEPEFCHADKGGFFQGAVDDRSAGEIGQVPDIRNIRFDFAARLRWAERTSGNYTSTGGNDHTNRWRQIIQPGDVVRSVEIGGSNKSNSFRGDVRLMALKDLVTASEPHSRYYNENYFKAYSIRTAAAALYDQVVGVDGAVIQGKRIGQATFGRLVNTPAAYPVDKAADVSEFFRTQAAAMRKDNQPGDWDSGMGSFPDGAFLNKPDEGNVQYKYLDTGLGKYVRTYPYFSWNDALVGETYFSPNRIMPSAVMFGSLPSGIISARSWETLAFSPNTAGPNHRGNVANPKDHLLLDLFTMPIVEPYAISEPCSTAGRVNLNYQIMPFTHIHRSSALRAALHSLRVMAVPGADVAKYKSSLQTINYRHLVDRDETVRSFEDFFSKFAEDRNTGFFKSATEICERYLYPKGVKFSPSDAAVKTWWNDKTLTGDNSREKPYADLYPRVTTKSNTYTVHMRVQTLRQGNGLSKEPEQYLRFEERPDAILGEYRGSTTIERYIDPNDRRFNANDPETLALGDYLDPDERSIEAAHRFRVVGVKRFAP